MGAIRLTEDLTGQRFGRLTPLYRNPIEKGVQTNWRCRCDCGNEVDVTQSNLKHGLIQSCGCLHRSLLGEKRRTHGMSNSKLYMAWLNMKARCHNANRREYKNYGGRGITVCNEWNKSSEKFVEWATSNGYRDGLTLDRIDVNGMYSPENCRWITNKEQQNNRRGNVFFEYKGERKTLAEWSETTGIGYKTLEKRFKKWGVERALTEPIHLDHKHS